VARKNGTLGWRALGHGGGWGDPNRSEESFRQPANPNDGGESLPPPIGARSRPFYSLTHLAPTHSRSPQPHRRCAIEQGEHHLR
jgi:hypothetical protein